MPDPLDEMSARISYVCMPGSPYTGSTLLGFLLNAHPDCVSIGAATGLTARVDLDSYQCSCGERFRDCGFWNQVVARTAALGAAVDVFETDYWATHVRMSRNRTLNGILVRSLGNDTLTDLRDALVARRGPVRRELDQARLATWSLARAILDITARRVFVDTARDHQRPKYLAPDPRIDVRVIHLVRDPRGNAASIMRHTGVDVATAAKQWRHYNVEADRVRRYVSPDSWMTLRYEDLCADPQATLDRIAQFLGVTPAPLPGDLQAGENHIVGNSMRLNGIKEIREDTRWKQTLSPADLAVIARTTGEASRRLGFGWP